MTRPFRVNYFLQGLVLWLVVLWSITAIDPLYPRDWLLENLLVFVYAALLVFTYRYFFCFFILSFSRSPSVPKPSLGFP
jgi:hypothetical protein